MPPDITSPSNERIKWLVRLRERRHRDAEGVFVVEGERLYARALAAGMEPEVTFVVPQSGIEVSGRAVTVEPSALDRASYRKRSQDVIAVFPQVDNRLAALPPAPGGLYLLAEGIEKPGNLGAVLRTAAAGGANALIAVGGAIDTHNPNVARASTGAVFAVPLAVTDWDELEPWLRSTQTRLICAAPTAPRAVWDTDLTGGVALAVGAEDAGLTDRAIAFADETVAIPQATHTVDSLNVSVAAGIILFEARRQRARSSR